MMKAIGLTWQGEITSPAWNWCFLLFLLRLHLPNSLFGKTKIVDENNDPIDFIDWHCLRFCYCILISICFKIKRLERMLIGTLKEALVFWYQICFQAFADIVSLFWHKYLSKCKRPQCATQSTRLHFVVS